MFNKLCTLKGFLENSKLKKEAQELNSLMMNSTTVQTPGSQAPDSDILSFLQGGAVNLPTETAGAAVAPAEEEEGRLDKVRAGAEEIRNGDKDTESDDFVTKIQTMLEGHGYTLDRFGVDGDFGSETEGEVLEFQQSNGVDPTGVVNSETLILMESSLAMQASAVAAAAMGAAAGGAIAQVPDAGPGEQISLPEDVLRRGRRKARRALRGGGGRVGASQLYNDLYSALGNKNLCIAMVANAIAESGMKPGIAGDCGDYAERRRDKSIAITGKGRCCSFGLWQYNICGGMGVGFLRANGNPSTEEGKMAVLSDYNLQVGYMTQTLKGRYSSEVSKQKSIDQWVDWFVREIERPRNPGASVTKRQGIARGLGGLGSAVV